MNVIINDVEFDSSENFLKHYGVLGMKWGKRKRRSSSDTTSKTKRGKKGKSDDDTPDSDDYKKSRQLKKKRLSKLSNQELRDLNGRLQLEANYKKLNPKKKSIGKKLFDSIIKPVAEQQTKNYLNKKVGQALDKADKDGFKNVGKQMMDDLRKKMKSK